MAQIEYSEVLTVSDKNFPQGAGFYGHVLFKELEEIVSSKPQTPFTWWEKYAEQYTSDLNDQP